MKTVKLLSSGHQMPVIGLGTWQAKPEEVEAAVTAALDNGYRHIDTAFNYFNEESIGRSIKRWLDDGGKREDLFVTSKLPMYGNKPSEVETYLKLSLERLGLDYLDMYLIHMPYAFVKQANAYAAAVNDDGTYQLEMDTDPVAIWKEMEKQVKNGKARSIGICNYNERQVLQICDNCEIKPSNLQVEVHAYNQQKPLRELCERQGIAVTAYSPLGSPGAKVYFNSKYGYPTERFPDLLGHPVVEKVAAAHGKTTAQVLLRHLTQGGVIVIPKSCSPERIKSNIDFFDFTLSDEEVESLNSLDRGEDGRIFDFLFWKGVEKHPQYPFTHRIKDLLK